MSPRRDEAAAVELSDLDRLRLIVAVCVDCKQVPTLRLVAKQFRHETGKVPELEMLEKVIGGQG